MKLSSLEKSLETQLTNLIADAAPGMCVQVYQKGVKVIDLQVGKTFSYYDLASLTKIIFTTHAMMWAFEQDKYTLNQLVKEQLPWFDSDQIKISQLLNHTSGLSWWLPIYQNLNLQDSKIHRWSETARMVREDLAKNKNHVEEKSVYSDVNFIVLGHLLESIYQKPLLEIWHLVKERFFKNTTFNFHEDNKPVYKPAYYAPTEESDWRKKLLQGEVHDDNTWALGGVSAHAGLFGSIDDMGWYILSLRNTLRGLYKNGLSAKTLKLFSARSIPVSVGDWALGYMMPTAGSASCGSYFSLDSFGHTGFTGTSSWYDPGKDIGVVILSNRTLYGRDNKTFAKTRPEIHNCIVKSLITTVG